jgi:hypothetical protein
MWQFLKGLGWLGIVITAVVLTVLAAVALYFLIVMRAHTTGNASSAPVSQAEQAIGDREASNAVVEHMAIISAILKCHGIYDVNSIPRGQQPTLHSGDIFSPSGSEKIIPLSSTDIAVAYLSKTLLQRRADTAMAVDGAQRQMILWQFAVIFGGAVATILVSLSSRSGGTGEPSKSFRVLSMSAVIASAAATALSSMSTFIGAQAVYASNQKSLSSLQQLHSEIATLFPFEYDQKVCGEKQDPRQIELINNNIQQWSSRLGTIVGGPSSSSNGGDAKSSSSK